MSWSYTMKISQNGQVSIPADVRSRWQTEQVKIVDMGGYIVIAPLTDDPISTIRGAYKGRGPSSDALRSQARSEDARDERRLLGEDRP